MFRSLLQCISLSQVRDSRLGMQDDFLKHLPRLLSTPASHSSLNVHAKQLTLQLLVFDWVTGRCTVTNCLQKVILGRAFKQGRGWPVSRGKWIRTTAWGNRSLKMCPEDICTEKTETAHLTYEDQIRSIFLIFLSAKTRTEYRKRKKEQKLKQESHPSSYIGCKFLL